MRAYNIIYSFNRSAGASSLWFSSSLASGPEYIFLRLKPRNFPFLLLLADYFPAKCLEGLPDLIAILSANF